MLINLSKMEINCRAHVLMLMSNCPDKTCDRETGRTMEKNYQNDIDRPHPNDAHYREILEDFRWDRSNR
jgi:hypothetical protein